MNVSHRMTLRWTSIPSTGSRNILNPFMLRKPTVFADRLHFDIVSVAALELKVSLEASDASVNIWHEFLCYVNNV